MSKVIKPRGEECYSSACARILWNYVNSNGQKEELEESVEVQEALGLYHSFSCRLQLNAFFGGELCEKVREVEERNEGKINKWACR